jgi:hypothetical protein
MTYMVQLEGGYWRFFFFPEKEGTGGLLEDIIVISIPHKGIVVYHLVFPYINT